MLGGSWRPACASPTGLRFHRGWFGDLIRSGSPVPFEPALLDVSEPEDQADRAEESDIEQRGRHGLRSRRSALQPLEGGERALRLALRVREDAT